MNPDVKPSLSNSSCSPHQEHEQKEERSKDSPDQKRFFQIPGLFCLAASFLNDSERVAAKTVNKFANKAIGDDAFYLKVLQASQKALDPYTVNYTREKPQPIQRAPLSSFHRVQELVKQGDIPTLYHLAYELFHADEKNYQRLFEVDRLLALILQNPNPPAELKRFFVKAQFLRAKIQVKEWLNKISDNEAVQYLTNVINEGGEGAQRDEELVALIREARFLKALMTVEGRPSGIGMLQSGQIFFDLFNEEATPALVKGIAKMQHALLQKTGRIPALQNEHSFPSLLESAHLHFLEASLDTNLPISERLEAKYLRIYLIQFHGLEASEEEQDLKAIEADLINHPNLHCSTRFLIKLGKAVNLNNAKNFDEAAKIILEIIKSPHCYFKAYYWSCNTLAKMMLQKQTAIITDQEIYDYLEKLLQNPHLPSDIILQIKIQVAQFLFQRRPTTNDQKSINLWGQLYQPNNPIEVRVKAALHLLQLYDQRRIVFNPLVYLEDPNVLGDPNVVANLSPENAALFSLCRLSHLARAPGPLAPFIVNDLYTIADNANLSLHNRSLAKFHIVNTFFEGKQNRTTQPQAIAILEEIIRDNILDISYIATAKIWLARELITNDENNERAFTLIQEAIPHYRLVSIVLFPVLFQFFMKRPDLIKDEKEILNLCDIVIHDPDSPNNLRIEAKFKKATLLFNSNDKSQDGVIANLFRELIAMPNFRQKNYVKLKLATLIQQERAKGSDAEAIQYLKDYIDSEEELKDEAQLTYAVMLFDKRAYENDERADGFFYNLALNSNIPHVRSLAKAHLAWMTFDNRSKIIEPELANKWIEENKAFANFHKVKKINFNKEAKELLLEILNDPNVLESFKRKVKIYFVDKMLEHRIEEDKGDVRKWAAEVINDNLILPKDKALAKFYYALLIFHLEDQKATQTAAQFFLETNNNPEMSAHRRALSRLYLAYFVDEKRTNIVSDEATLKWLDELIIGKDLDEVNKIFAKLRKANFLMQGRPQFDYALSAALYQEVLGSLLRGTKPAKDVAQKNLLSLLFDNRFKMEKGKYQAFLETAIKDESLSLDDQAKAKLLLAQVYLDEKIAQTDEKTAQLFNEIQAEEKNDVEKRCLAKIHLIKMFLDDRTKKIDSVIAQTWLEDILKLQKIPQETLAKFLLAKLLFKLKSKDNDKIFNLLHNLVFDLKPRLMILEDAILLFTKIDYGKCTHVEKLLQEVIKSPQYSDWVKTNVHYHLGKRLLKTKPEEALKHFEAILNNNLTSLNLKGLAKLNIAFLIHNKKINRDLKEAATLYEEAASLLNNHAEMKAKYWHAKLLFDGLVKDDQKAALLFKEVLASNFEPTPSSRQVSINCLFEMLKAERIKLPKKETLEILAKSNGSILDKKIIEAQICYDHSEYKQAFEILEALLSNPEASADQKNKACLLQALMIAKKQFVSPNGVQIVTKALERQNISSEHKALFYSFIGETRFAEVLSIYARKNPKEDLKAIGILKDLDDPIYQAYQGQANLYMAYMIHEERALLPVSQAAQFYQKAASNRFLDENRRNLAKFYHAKLILEKLNYKDYELAFSLLEEVSEVANFCNRSSKILLFNLLLEGKVDVRNIKVIFVLEKALREEAILDSLLFSRILSYYLNLFLRGNIVWNKEKVITLIESFIQNPHFSEYKKITIINNLPFDQLSILKHIIDFRATPYAIGQASKLKIINLRENDLNEPFNDQLTVNYIDSLLFYRENDPIKSKLLALKVKLRLHNKTEAVTHGTALKILCGLCFTVGASLSFWNIFVYSVKIATHYVISSLVARTRRVYLRI